MTVAIGDIKRILVVGAGQMGAQIAMQSALHGYAVTLNDLSTAILEKAMAANRGHLDRRVAKGQMSQAEMDQVVNDHFMYEFTDNVDGVVSTLTEDVVHEIIGAPFGPQQGKAAARRVYERLFPDIKGETVKNLMRLYGENFLIDVTMWTGQIFDGKYFNLDGRSGKASVRLLHVFRLCEGKIELEQVWIDYDALKKQLT